MSHRIRPGVSVVRPGAPISPPARRLCRSNRRSEGLPPRQHPHRRLELSLIKRMAVAGGVLPALSRQAEATRFRRPGVYLRRGSCVRARRAMSTGSAAVRRATSDRNAIEEKKRHPA
ncbi:hypothetical protein AAFF_G00041700 [Aldrovandia affinis]|uniref:Uncharacterized protein n=1 Tax=Aldrovandia affinis TaxID=143900 RepID=A0AAD7WFM2_9TELE|nr:hypothetical protein AAFF_G00041700 [Aldrovandia affinis]